jgi:antitoxin (DNA-binding transcriptional repressor) of toxin-antitoxin stability system
MEVSVELLGPLGKELASRARKGETIVLSEPGEAPVALTPSPRPRGGLRGRGIDRGRLVVPADFDAPLPEDVLREFER